MPAKKSRTKSREIRAWFLWSLKTIQRLPDPGLLNLTKALETLHWCLAARWRIVEQQNIFRILAMQLSRSVRSRYENPGISVNFQGGGPWIAMAHGDPWTFMDIHR